MLQGRGTGRTLAYQDTAKFDVAFFYMFVIKFYVCVAQMNLEIYVRIVCHICGIVTPSIENKLHRRVNTLSVSIGNPLTIMLGGGIACTRDVLLLFVVVRGSLKKRCFKSGHVLMGSKAIKVTTCVNTNVVIAGI